MSYHNAGRPLYGAAPGQPPSPALITIGDISAGADWLATPAGIRPLAGTEVIVTDMTTTESKTPTWAIILAVLGILFFLLGLLFLLVKEKRTSGFIQVTVRNGRFLHVANIPIHSPQVAGDVHARANYLRQLAISAF